MPRAAESDIRLRRSGIAVGVAGGTLVAASLVGGLISISAGVNSWATAWSSAATLAAPWPMVVIQSATTNGAAQSRRGLAIVCSALLGLSAAVAGISGFFDGQLGRADLGPSFVAAQVGYVAIAWLTVAAAAYRLWRLASARA